MKQKAAIHWLSGPDFHYKPRSFRHPGSNRSGFSARFRHFPRSSHWFPRTLLPCAVLSWKMAESRSRELRTGEERTSDRRTAKWEASQRRAKSFPAHRQAAVSAWGATQTLPCYFYSSAAKSAKSQEISAGEFFQVIAHFQYSSTAAATVLENGGSAASVLLWARRYTTCVLVWKFTLDFFVFVLCFFLCSTPRWSVYLFLQHVVCCLSTVDVYQTEPVTLIFMF